MDLKILGLGTAVPPHTMSQEEATELAQQICCTTDEQARLLNVLYRRSGVSNRHTVLPHRIALDWLAPDEGPCAVETLVQLGPTTQERMKFYEEHAFPLAYRAARAALADAQTQGSEITHLVTVSCTGFSAPGVDVNLMTQLGLAPTTERVHVGFMGCHGAINGLRVARAIALSDSSAKVLLCAVELCSLHYRFQWDPKRFIGNAIFADGAAALVATADGDLPGTPDDSNPWKVVATGSCLLPESQDAMTWEIGDHGFEMELSPRVPDLIHANLKQWVEPWLAGQGFELNQIGSWAIHPGGPRILSAVEEALGLNSQATIMSREVLSRFGNMSSPTILFILQRMQAHAAPRPCLAIGFGPGLVAEAALLI